MAGTTSISVDAPAPPAKPYAGWAMALIAAAAMVGTFPGRTHGLGMAAKDLQQDFRLSQSEFARINLWATLLGALACAPAGWAVDRWGARRSTAAVALLLAAATLATPLVAGTAALAAAICCQRAFGQSALSVCSLAVTGRWFRRRLAGAMTVYSLAVGLGFMAAFGAMGWLIRTESWRGAWQVLTAVLALGLAPLAWRFLRDVPQGAERDVEFAGAEHAAELHGGMEFSAALATPLFWVFAHGISLYGLVASGLSLFNEQLLAAQGFQREDYHRALVGATGCGIVGQLAGGAALRFVGARAGLAIALGFHGTALLALPAVRTYPAFWAYVAASGFAGGMLTMLFFAVWPLAYGRKRLGRIQGAAQLLTVLASAAGPVAFAAGHDRFGGYAETLTALGGATLAAAFAAMIVPWPRSAAPEEALP